MRLTRKPVTAATLVIVAVLAIGGLIGCGNNASGESSTELGTLASADGASDLSGTWVLNKDLSDHPRRPDSLGRPDSTDRPDHWRRRRDRDGHGPRPDSLRDGRHMRGPFKLVIEQTDSTVAISGPRGRTRLIYPDGRVVTHARDNDSVAVEVTATWNSEGHLVIVGTGPKGGTRTETFALSAAGDRLIIDTRVDPASDREPRDFRRVFDSAPSGN